MTQAGQSHSRFLLPGVLLPRYAHKCREVSLPHHLQKQKCRGWQLWTEIIFRPFWTKAVPEKNRICKSRVWLNLNWTGGFRLNWIEDWTVPIEMNSIEPFLGSFFFEVWQPFSRACTLLVNRKKNSRAPPVILFITLVKNFPLTVQL